MNKRCQMNGAFWFLVCIFGLLLARVKRKNPSKIIEFTSLVARQRLTVHAKSNHLNNYDFLFFCHVLLLWPIHRCSLPSLPLRFLRLRWAPDPSIQFIASIRTLSNIFLVLPHDIAIKLQNSEWKKCELQNEEREKNIGTQWLRQMLMKFPMQAATLSASCDYLP